MSAAVRPNEPLKPTTGGRFTFGAVKEFFGKAFVDITGRKVTLPTIGGAARRRQFDWTSLFSGAHIHCAGDVPMSTLSLMERTDETISSGIEFIMLSVIYHMGTYKNPNPKAQAYADQLWPQCRNTFEGFIEELLTCLIYGHSCGQLVLREGEGKIWLDEVAMFSPEKFLYVNDGEDHIAGISLNGNPFSGFLPASDLITCAHKGWFGNPYGRSRMIPSYPIWVMKHRLLKTWGLTLERFSAPITIAKCTNPKQPELDKNGLMSTRQEILLDLLTNLQAGTSVVLPGSEEVTIDQLDSPVGDNFERFQNHANKMLLRGLLLPALLFEPTDVGSFALGKKQFEVFLSSIRKIVKMCREAILAQIYRPLMQLNFGRNCPTGEFVGPDKDEDELKVLSEIVFSLTNSGWLKPSQQADLDEIRSWFKLPQASSENYQEPQAPAAAQPDSAGPPTPRPGPKTPKKPQGRPAK